MQNSIFKLLRGRKTKAPAMEINAAGQAAREVRAAARELKQAYGLFQYMEQPDMIDYATYTIKAAEMRYQGLLKAYRAAYGQFPASEDFASRGGE